MEAHTALLETEDIGRQRARKRGSTKPGHTSFDGETKVGLLGYVKRYPQRTVLMKKKGSNVLS